MLSGSSGCLGPRRLQTCWVLVTTSLDLSFLIHGGITVPSLLALWISYEGFILTCDKYEMSATSDFIIAPLLLSRRSPGCFPWEIRLLWSGSCFPLQLMSFYPRHSLHLLLYPPDMMSFWNTPRSPKTILLPLAVFSWHPLCLKCLLSAGILVTL